MSTILQIDNETISTGNFRISACRISRSILFLSSAKEKSSEKIEIFNRNKMGKRRRENDTTDEAPRSKRGSQADEEDDDLQQTQGESQEDDDQDDEPMEEKNEEDFQDDIKEPGKNGNYF